MRILIYGAGVIGSLLGGKLAKAGHHVSVLARGKRLDDLRAHGLVLVDGFSGRRTEVRVDAVESLKPDDYYDLVIVPVRKDQIADIIPVLAGNSRVMNVLVMVNSTEGPGQWADALGHNRLLLGFPGAGGAREDHIVRYNIVSPLIQATTLGEPDGRITPRLRCIQKAFAGAGIPTAISRNMSDWQKTHVAWVSPFANGIYMFAGDPAGLKRSKDGVRLMLTAIREAFAGLRKAEVRVTPGKLNVFRFVPLPVLTAIFRWYLGTRHCDLVVTRHAIAARDEMQALAEELAALVHRSGQTSQAFDQLYRSAFGEADGHARSETDPICH